jgi:hypothetical protein
LFSDKKIDGIIQHTDHVWKGFGFAEEFHFMEGMLRESKKNSDHKIRNQEPEKSEDNFDLARRLRFYS